MWTLKITSLCKINVACRKCSKNKIDSFFYFFNSTIVVQNFNRYKNNKLLQLVFLRLRDTSCALLLQLSPALFVHFLQFGLDPLPLSLPDHSVVVHALHLSREKKDPPPSRSCLTNT